MRKARRSNAERRARLVLGLALALSLILHLSAGGVWTYFGHRVASAVARFLPRPKPTPSEIVATSDAITITRQTVPRPMRVPAQRPAPNALAQRPLQRTIPIPTLAPLPSPQPTREPKPAPSVRAVAYAKIHRPRPEPSSPAYETPRYDSHEHVIVPHV